MNERKRIEYKNEGDKGERKVEEIYSVFIARLLLVSKPGNLMKKIKEFERNVNVEEEEEDNDLGEAVSEEE